jgi:murein DD-endopeptidase MepM/ murein hydrolase activator NlpD
MHTDWEAVRRRREIRDALEKQGLSLGDPFAVGPNSHHSFSARWQDRASRRSSSRYHRRWAGQPASSAGSVLQVIGAALLLAGLFALYHSQVLPGKWQNDLKEALSYDTDWQGLSGWYQTTFGDRIAWPALGGQIPDGAFTVPVKGKVTADYVTDAHPWITYRGSPGEDVVAAGKGLVETVGSNPSMGNYLIINHGKTGKTMYGHLGDITVHQDDWVFPGQRIGHLPDQDPQMVFGYLVNDHYVNPHKLLDNSAGW